MLDNSLEAEWEQSTEKKVIMSVDRHFILVLAEMKEGVKGSRVLVEGRHFKLLREAERGDFP